MIYIGGYTLLATVIYAVVICVLLVVGAQLSWLCVVPIGAGLVVGLAALLCGLFRMGMDL